MCIIIYYCIFIYSPHHHTFHNWWFLYHYPIGSLNCWGIEFLLGTLNKKKIIHCFLQENDPQMLGVPHLFKVWFCFFSFVGKSCSEIGFAAIYLVRLKSAKFHVEVLRRPKITGP